MKLPLPPVLVLLAAACAAPSDAPRPPNVILIVADDLGAMDLGCYGSTFHRTPHLDRLAREGVRFTHSYAATPVCSPSRAALLTGLHPQRFGITDWIPGRGDRAEQRLRVAKVEDHLPLEAVTLAERLASVGYVTAHLGKWHLGGAGHGPCEQGFATNVGGDESGNPTSYFAPFRGRGGKPMPGLTDAPAGEYLTDRLAREAERFLEGARGKPFVLHLAHFAPHTPLEAKPELLARHPAASPFRGAQGNPIYAAMLESLDESVGRILAKLDELGLDDDTIVVFTSDNGGLATQEGPNTPATSNAPLREGKGWLYEGGLRTPLLVRWPARVPGGRVSNVPVAGIDLAPTLAEACGGTSAPGDGVSLLRLLERGEAIARAELCWHYPHYANQGSRPGAAIRAGRFKLVEFLEEGRRELYDLEKDPSETTNLVDREAEVVASLAARLATWRAALGIATLAPNPAYRPNPPGANGVITMHARSADLRGTQLRYEPLPHKSTLGYWTRTEDWARFPFTVVEPGTFEVEALVGCGKGSAGATVHFEFARADAETPFAVLPLRVPETGGFQAFRPIVLGNVPCEEEGRYEVRVRAITKPGPAVMDLRSLTLRPRAR